MIRTLNNRFYGDTIHRYVDWSSLIILRGLSNIGNIRYFFLHNTLQVRFRRKP